jgi:hypothetical protein
VVTCSRFRCDLSDGPLAVAYLSDLDALDALVVGITTAYHVVTLPRPSVVTLERESGLMLRSYGARWMKSNVTTFPR